jgi:hypothetical protein
VPSAVDPTAAASGSDASLHDVAVYGQAPAARWRRVLKAALPLQVMFTYACTHTNIKQAMMVVMLGAACLTPHAGRFLHSFRDLLKKRRECDPTSNRQHPLTACSLKMRYGRKFDSFDEDAYLVHDDEAVPTE